MAVDALAVIFVLALTALGWFRGAIAQLVTIGAALGLWFGWELWYPPVDLWLAGMGPAFNDHPFVRQGTAFVGAYLAVVIAVFLVERLVVQNVEALDATNRGAGAFLGGVKGIAYAIALIWIVEGMTIWGKPKEEPMPAWWGESGFVELVGPYNPVRVFTLKELAEELVRRGKATKKAEDEEGTGSGEELGEAQADAGDRGQERTELENDRDVFAWMKKSPIGRILDDTASYSEWSGSTYGQLIMDPRVRELLRDKDFTEDLLGGGDEE